MRMKMRLKKIPDEALFLRCASTQGLLRGRMLHTLMATGAPKDFPGAR